MTRRTEGWNGSVNPRREVRAAATPVRPSAGPPGTGMRPRIRLPRSPARAAALLVAAALVAGTPPAPATATPLPAQVAPGAPVAILAAKVIDAAHEQPLHDAAVLVRDGRIAAVGDRDIVPPGARVIDLGGLTLLPGLIDAHSHILISTDSYQTDHLRWSSAYKALRALLAAQANLRHGFTTLRIAGDADVYYAHLEVRRAIDEGLFLGPRITGAGHYISVTGGGGDLNQFAPEQHLIADGLVVDGPEAMRRAVRQEIKYGSDWIKVLVTGAFFSTGDNPGDVHFSPEELEAVVAEATRRGVPVMAHAHAAAGIRMAIAAGVRSIEHGTFVDDEGLEMMLQHGTYWVPTVYIGRYYLEQGTDEPDLQKMMELTRRTQAAFEGQVREGIRRGVRIVVGSDFGGSGQERNVREIETLVDLGMTPLQAIRAATLVSAEMLGWQERVGSIQPGRYADLIAVQGDPLRDISALRDVRFVMVGGKVALAPE